MGIFGRRIDIKNATKTTYSDEDLRKLDLNYRNEFQIDREKRIYTPFRKEMPRAWQSQVRDMAFEKILDDRLSKPEKYVLGCRYFSRPAKTYEQVGTEFSLSRESVRRIERKALRKLMYA